MPLNPDLDEKFASPLMEGETQIFYIKFGDMAVLREDITFFKDSKSVTRCHTWGMPIKTYNEWGECTCQTPVNYEPLTLNDVVLVLDKTYDNPKSTDWWVLLPEGVVGFLDGRFLVPLGHNRRPSVRASDEQG
jgi:hypothetical protein